MKRIKQNFISHQIWMHNQGHTGNIEKMSKQILLTVYGEDKKSRWTRILRNTSQPSLEESAAIAEILQISIDDLFKFEPLKQTA